MPASVQGMTPLVSVIVPVRNGMPFLLEALASIQAQPAGPLEILVVDGGSTDGSRAAAAAHPAVRLIDQEGRGLAAARNQGLAQARGEVIAFLDADDRWAAGWLRAALDCLHADPACAAVLGQMVRFLQPGVELPPGYGSAWLDRPAPGYTPGALLARRAVFDQVGQFDDTLTVGCDSDWFARALDAGIAINHLPVVMLYKRIHAGNLSAQVATYRRELLTVARRSLVRRNIIPAGQDAAC